MGERITHAEFARQIAYLIGRMAPWAGDTLGPLPRHLDPVAPETVGRFTDEVRSRLDDLDRWAGRAAQPATNPRGAPDA